MYECLNRGMSTSELAQTLRENLAIVRREVVRLHHLGVIEPIAIRSEAGDPPARLYFRDLVWDLTEHGREHNRSYPGCTACMLRERMLLRMQHPPF